MKLIFRIGSSIIIVLLVIFLIFQAVLLWGRISNQNNTKAFLQAIKVQQYEEAAQLFAGTTDKTKWVNEMKRLNEEKGFKLLSYSHVKAEYDDGAINIGHADLTFEVDGEPLKVKAIVTFGAGATTNQVCAITPSGQKAGSIPHLEAWNQLVCGGSF